MHGPRAWICASIIFLCGLSDNWAAEPQVQYNLLTLPSTRQAQMRLVMPARLDYERAPLRMCVAQLAEHFQVSYWIDRRVDAEKPVTIRNMQGTLGECLSKIAQACSVEVGLVENVVTIAPPQHLADMQYAAVRLHNQLSFSQAKASDGGGGKRTSSSTSTSTSNAEFRPLTWPVLTTPSELSQLINTTWNLALPSDLPHDLMNAGQLQPCTVSTQLTLLYSGFGQCVAGRGLQELRVLPMPKSGNWQAEYAASAISNDQIAIVKNKYPDLQFDKSKNLVTVVGPTAAHLALLQTAPASAKDRGGRSPRTTPANSDEDPFARQRFDISKQADQPLGRILESLGLQLGLQIEWDKALPRDAQTRLVTLAANKARLDEVLNGLAEQAKLSIKREGTRVTVSNN